MTNVFNRTLAAVAAIASVTTALVLAGGPARAQAPPQDGPNGFGGTVVVGGEVVGQDPDPGIRSRLYIDHDNSQ